MRRAPRGFTYLALLFAVAIAGVVLAAVGVLWSTERQRQREAELLVIGGEFRAAIAGYYESSPGLVKRYPAKLDDLLKDDRFLSVRRHLRQVYLDPMTATHEWGLTMAPEGGIMGVYSLSETTPIKQSGFPPEWAGFEGKQHYSDWIFAYRPVEPKASGSVVELVRSLIQ
jgi:type II secretory pathway pseudopilin PulG